MNVDTGSFGKMMHAHYRLNYKWGTMSKKTRIKKKIKNKKNRFMEERWVLAYSKDALANFSFYTNQCLISEIISAAAW